MRIATVDSSCSILDDHLMPTSILSTAALVVDLPYVSPLHVEYRPGNYSITDPNVLLYELQLCSELVETQDVDCVHLDLTLGGKNLLEITDDELFQMPLSPTGRSILHAIMPDLHRIASRLQEEHQTPVLAMGKRSIPVRLAELHAAAYGVRMAVEMAKKSDETIHLGLPARTLASFDEPGKVCVRSEEPMEGQLQAEAAIDSPIHIEPYLNPVTRGFQVLRISTAPTY